METSANFPFPQSASAGHSHSAQSPEGQQQEMFINHFCRGIFNRFFPDPNHINQDANIVFSARAIRKTVDLESKDRTLISQAINDFILPELERIVAKEEAIQQERAKQGMGYNYELMGDMYARLALLKMIALPAQLSEEYIEPAASQAKEAGIRHLDNAMRIPQVATEGIANMTDASLRHLQAIQEKLGTDFDLDALVQASAGKALIDGASAPIKLFYDKLVPGLGDALQKTVDVVSERFKKRANDADAAHAQRNAENPSAHHVEEISRKKFLASVTVDPINYPPSTGSSSASGPSVSASQTAPMLQFPPEKELTEYLLMHAQTRPKNRSLYTEEKGIVEKIAAVFGGQKIPLDQLQNEVTKAFEMLKAQGQIPANLANPFYDKLYTTALRDCVKAPPYTAPKSDSLTLPSQQELAHYLTQHPAVVGLQASHKDKGVIDQLAKELAGRTINIESLQHELAGVLQGIAENGKLPKSVVTLTSINLMFSVALKDCAWSSRRTDPSAAATDPYSHLQPLLSTLKLHFPSADALLAYLKNDVQTARLNPQILEKVASHFSGITQDGAAMGDVVARLMQDFMTTDHLKGESLFKLRADLINVLIDSASHSMDTIDLGNQGLPDPTIQQTSFRSTPDPLPKESTPDDPVEMLESEEKKIRALLEEFKPETGKKSKPDFGKIAFTVGVQLAHDAAAYIEDRSKMRHASAAVKAFVSLHERESARRGREIPGSPDALRHSLVNLAEIIQRPERIADSYVNLEKAGRELAKAIAELKQAKEALSAERNKIQQDLAEIDRLDQRYRFALKKALNSASRAREKVGIFSTILNTAGSVLSVIPTPATMVIGGSLLAATSTTRQLTSANTDKILDHRVQKFQGHLSANLANREQLVMRVRDIAGKISAIEASQAAYESWILSQESASQLTVQDRYTHLQSINADTHKRLDGLEDTLASKQAVIDKLRKEWNHAQGWLDATRAIPGIDTDKKYKYQWRTYNGVLATQTKRGEQLAQLEADKESFIQNQLNPAREEAAARDDQLAHETQLRPLREFREALFKQFDQPISTVPNSQEFSLETLILYHQRRYQSLAPIMNALGAGGELARELYFAGSPLPYYLHAFTQNSMQFCLSLDSLRVTYNQWEVDKTGLNTKNMLDLVIVPGVRAMAAAVGLYNAGFAILYLGKQLLYGEPRQKGLFDYIHEDLCQQVQHLAKWMESRFEHASREFAAWHAQEMHKLDQMRQEHSFITDEILIRLDQKHDEILEYFRDQKFDHHLELVQLQVKAIQQRSRINLDEFLGFIKEECKASRKGLWNGFQYLNSQDPLAEEGWGRNVDLKLIYQRPSHFTGLLARVLALPAELPNLELLLALKRALRKVELPLPENITKRFEQISQEIEGMEQEVLDLFDQIEPLVLWLHKEQKAFFEKAQKNRNESLKAKAAYQQGELQKAHVVFKEVAKTKPLGSDRAFLKKVAETPFKKMMPDYDYFEVAEVANHGTHWLARFQHVSYGWLAKDAATMAVAAPLALIPPLTLPTLISIVAHMTIRTANDIFTRRGALLKRVAERPLKECLVDLSRGRLALAKSNWGNQSTISTSEVWPSDATKTLGIDPKQHKVVEMKANTPSHVVPFLNCDLSIKLFRFDRPAEHIRLSLADRSFVTIEQIHEIASMDPRIKDEKVTALFKAYGELLEAQITDTPVTSSFAKALGESMFIPSHMQQLVPLAFPKKLFESLERQIALEMAFVETARLGNFIPHYEFSPETNLLSIVYCLVSPMGRSSTPYCKFHVAQFDSVTTASFQKELNHMGVLETELKDANEFLIWAMYGGIFGLGLPGSQTMVLKNGFVAPVDHPFPGLYAIFLKDPTAMLQYDALDYTQERRNELSIWLATGNKTAVCSMIESNQAPFFYPESYQIRRSIHEAKMSAFKESSYERKYYVLMALIKLFSSCKNREFLGALQGKLSIYPPAARAMVLSAGPLSEDPSESIKTFVDLLERTPSAQKLSLRKLLIRSEKSTSTLTPDENDAKDPGYDKNENLGSITKVQKGEK